MFMTRTIEAIFDGKVFRPSETLTLEPNTHVQIVIDEKPPIENKSKSFLSVARSLRLQGPKDFSEKIDEYLYGGEDLDGK
jgi:predicted DNA-binding antitoxin AbrB/MazE fold protein